MSNVAKNLDILAISLSVISC